MLKKQLLIALTIITIQPNTTHTITKKTALTLSTGTGILSFSMAANYIMNTRFTNQNPTQISQKISTCGIIGIAAASFCYWIVGSLTPEARLKRASSTHQALINDILLNYSEDSNEYLQNIELQYIQSTYPLLIAFENLKSALDKAIANNDILTKALYDTYQGTYINSSILRLKHETDFLIKMIKKNLLIIKRDPNFTHQYESSQKLELLERQVIAEEQRVSLLTEKVLLSKAKLFDPKIIQISFPTKK